MPSQIVVWTEPAKVDYLQGWWKAAEELADSFGRIGAVAMAVVPMIVICKIVDIL